MAVAVRLVEDDVVGSEVRLWKYEVAVKRTGESRAEAKGSRVLKKRRKKVVLIVARVGGRVVGRKWDRGRNDGVFVAWTVLV
jgi:hypothetical protein